MMAHPAMWRPGNASSGKARSIVPQLSMYGTTNRAHEWLQVAGNTVPQSLPSTALSQQVATISWTLINSAVKHTWASAASASRRARSGRARAIMIVSLSTDSSGPPLHKDSDVKSCHGADAAIHLHLPGAQAPRSAASTVLFRQLLISSVVV